ncbi:High-affinity glucose transporter [Spathaspora sp. JA1]|nr:High-affinity glucose transporter [Spathaspora sp. JA1]
MDGIPHHHIQIKETFLVGNALLNFTSIFVSLGVFLFGFEQGLMSSLITNKYFKHYYNNPSPAAIGIMIAILEIGALGSSFIAGKVGDKTGRRKTIRYGSFIFIIGGIIQATSINIFNLSVGRFISGIAIGFLTTIIPCYQSEISPPDHRGFYACLEFTGNIIGYSSSIWLDYGFSFLENNYSWRSPLIVQVVMGTLLYLGTFIIVETPRWLLDHDHDIEGMIVIADLYGNGDVENESAKNEYRNIKENVLIDRIEGGERSYKYLFQRYAKRLSVACFSQMFAQFNGINLIAYYAPLIFESAGWKGRSAILMSGINSIIYIFSTIPPWFLVDGWGRKPLLISGAILMGLPLYITGYSLYLDNHSTPIVVVTCIITTMAAFGYSWGPIPWLMSEVFPNNVRSKGAAVSVAVNWLCNFIVGFGSPILLDVIKWKTYLIPATSCVISLFAVHYLFPETKGLSLEDMGSVFDDKSSIFSFHSSGIVDSSTSVRSNASVRSNSSIRYGAISPGPELNQSSPASIQRNPATMRLDGFIVPPTITTPLKGDINTSGTSFDTPIFTDNVPEEIEPPTFDEIIQFKQKQFAKSNILTRFFIRGQFSIEQD